MQDLKEVTQDSHYENFRAAQLSGETPMSKDLIDSPANGKRYMYLYNINSFDNDRMYIVESLSASVWSAWRGFSQRRLNE